MQFRKFLRRLVLGLAAFATPASAQRILFVGNSFTFGYGSPVKAWRATSVHDLNHEGIGGVPALFKMFANESGLNWDVSLETEPGRDFAFHLASKQAELTGAWDVVVLQDYSTLDPQHPGDPVAHVRDAARLASIFKSANPDARVWIETTWSRADLTYPPGTHWYGKPIGAMTADLAHGNMLALAESRDLSGALPVGQAWLRAMREGIADADPYNGIDYGKIDLWTWDHYHASAAGYYLAALVIFGGVTGIDPVTLGARERAADELGINPNVAAALQRVAAAELTSASGRDVLPRASYPTGNPRRP